jgi:low affinity Fe/Cu permease
MVRRSALTRTPSTTATGFTPTATPACCFGRRLDAYSSIGRRGELAKAKAKPLPGTGDTSPGSAFMEKRPQSLLTNAGAWLSRPWVIGLVLVYVMLWLAFEPAHFGWHEIATVATLLMTLFIQRAEHRDTQAIHAKLDELLRTNGDARSHLTRLDKKEPEQIEAFRDSAQKSD